MKRLMLALMAGLGVTTLSACADLGLIPGNPDVDMGITIASLSDVDLTFRARPGATGGVVTEIRFLVNGSLVIRTSGSVFGPGCVGTTPTVGETYTCTRRDPGGSVGLHNAIHTYGSPITLNVTFSGAVTSLVMESFTVKGESGITRVFPVNRPIVAP